MVIRDGKELTMSRPRRRGIILSRMGAPWTYESRIDGAWTSADANGLIDVIDPATEKVIGSGG
jgi:hypothetical protein